MDAKEAGLKLQQAREAQSLTLEQVAQSTHMRLRYLQALEAGTLEVLPSRAQARGFLRAYAGFLKLEPEELLTALNNPAPVGEKDTPAPSPFSPPPSSPATAYSVRPSAEAISPQSLEQSNRIFQEIGQRLQRQRELLGLSLDDVVRHTLLRRHYLQALEAGTLDVLPSPVQGRGMLTNYAVFLGMDPDPLLLRFAEGLQARLISRQPGRGGAEATGTEANGTPPPVKRRLTPPALPTVLRRIFPSDLMVGIFLILSLATFTIWGAIRIFAMNSAQAPAATAPSIADVLLATSTPTLTPTPLPPSPTVPLPGAFPPPVEDTPDPSLDATALPPEEGAEGEVPPDGETSETPAVSEEEAAQATAAISVQVSVTVRERTFLRAVVDGKVQLEGRVLPGSAYTFAGEQQVELLTGNGSALQVIFNDQDQGLLGQFGQVVNRIYTRQGVVAPTATVTPTPTATSRLSPTLPVSTGTVTAPALP